MAPIHIGANGSVSYNVWLDAFDDNLWSAQYRPQRMRLVASEFLDHHWSNTKEEIQKDWYSRQDSWCFPTAHEKDLEKWDSDNHCFWIGWFVPAIFRKYRYLEPGQCVNNCSGKLLDGFSVTKAFKVVYKAGGTSKSKLFALHSPDRKGVCKAVSVPGGVCSVLFFEEWRDDTVTAQSTRQKSWLKKVMSISLAEASSFAEEASARLQPNGREHQSSHDGSWLTDDFVVEDKSTSCNDSDGDGSEYVFSGSESPESDNDSQASHTDAQLKPADDEAEDGSEADHMENKVTDFVLKRPRPLTHALSIVSSTKKTASDDRRSAKRGITKELGAELQPLPGFQDISWGSLFASKAVADTAEHGGRSRIRRKPRATRLDTEIPGTETKKRQIGQYGELSSKHKRSRSSRQTSTALVKAENRDSSDEDQEKPPVAVPIATTSTERAAFILDFIAAGKLAKVARLQDAVSRRLTLKAFRKHLASTSEAESDALAHNIAKNDDEDTRIMLAEALVADLEEKMAEMS
ncbi:hypothetical protein LZ30DRAFT_772118 [Colletotrichum cereale]|nr:hypothetical protein LZ30DRAFT_772118 [Colletotrichum cereale]